MEDQKNIIPNYDLLAKYFAGEASVAQIKEIEKWVEDNPKNKKSFDSMYYLWVQSAHRKLETQINVVDSWTKMKFRMNAAKENKPESPKVISTYNKTRVRLLQLAAVIVLGLMISSLIRFLVSEPETIYKVTQQASIELKLPDSSDIKLNKKSKISYPEKFKGNQRLVKLNGEAFFKITPDKEKPFIIETAYSQIKVVGTSFNVQAYDSTDIVEVLVVSGTVQLSGKDENSTMLILNKGEKGQIEKSTGKIFKIEEIQENELFWANRTLIFKDTELYIAAETIARSYNVEIEITNDNLRYCKLDVVFSNATIEEIIEVLRITFNLTIEQTKNHYKLNGIHCK